MNLISIDLRPIFRVSHKFNIQPRCGCDFKGVRYFYYVGPLCGLFIIQPRRGWTSSGWHLFVCWYI